MTLALTAFDNQYEKLYGSFIFQQPPVVRPKPWKDGRTNTSAGSSKTNLGSHTLPNNQCGQSFSLDAFYFPRVSSEWSLTGRSCMMESTRGNLLSKRFRAIPSKLGRERRLLSLQGPPMIMGSCFRASNNSMRNAC